MKLITFQNLLEFDFEGTVLQKAICLGDVDNDTQIELVVGNSKGNISIFKYEHCQKTCSMSIDGVITVVCIGDALNLNKNVLVVITSCGQLHIYDFTKHNFDLSRRAVRAVHSQRIMANIRTAVIGDINGDGCLELVVGLTDRVVRSYRWFVDDKAATDIYAGRFVSINKWDFADQIGGIAFNDSADKGPSLLVSQPGGSFHCLKVEPYEYNSYAESCDELSPNGVEKIDLDSSEAWPKLRTAEICGNVKVKDRNENGPGVFAAATLDGLLVLAQDEKIIWKMNLDHQIFALNCLDLGGKGNDSVVACAWNGSTFISSENSEFVKFQLKQPVSAFVAGMFSVEKRAVTCLVYATFSNKVLVYYDLNMAQSMSPLTAVARRNPDYVALLEQLQLTTEEDDKIQKLHYFALYGQRSVDS